MNITVVSLQDRYDLFQAQDMICSEAWPEFMLHDPIGNKYWMRFINAFKDYQLLLMDKDEILAIVNSVPLRYDGELSDLPDDGWDWGIEKCIADLDQGIQPNMLFGVQVVVNKRHQGKGLSQLATREMAKLAVREGLGTLIIPVRPNEKCNFPLIPMHDYIHWKNQDNLPFDSWLRVHHKLGGKIIKVCNTAMRIGGTIKEWETWTGQKFPGSGLHIVSGALNPIDVDIANDHGLYIEPNVWVAHTCS